MSIETNGNRAEREKSAAELELRKLEQTLNDLKVVEATLKLEEDTADHAENSMRDKQHEATLVSDEAVRAAFARGESLSDEERARLSLVQEEQREAQGFVADLDDHKSFEHRGLGRVTLTEALAVKLKSLGIDADNLDEYPRMANSASLIHVSLDSALNQRRVELVHEIRDKKLEVPGGKEELVLEALQKSNALSAENIDQLSMQFDAVRVAQLSMAEVYNPIAPIFNKNSYMGGISDYPAPVQEGVLRQMVQMALAQSRSDLDMDETVTALKAFIPKFRVQES